jgi:hypothetical protein
MADIFLADSLWIFLCWVVILLFLSIEMVGLSFWGQIFYKSGVVFSTKTIEIKNNKIIGVGRVYRVRNTVIKVINEKYMIFISDAMWGFFFIRFPVIAGECIISKNICKIKYKTPFSQFLFFVFVIITISGYLADEETRISLINLKNLICCLIAIFIFPVIIINRYKYINKSLIKLILKICEGA